MEQLELFDKKGSRGFYSPKNRLNNLTGKEWVYWSKSVITKQYPRNYQHKLRSQHGGQKPPDLCADIIKMFTKENQLVLDPFMGVGGTLIGAAISKRDAIGVEINERWVDIYRQVCSLEAIEEKRAIVGDSKFEVEKLGSVVDFILTDVPYWNMDRLEKSKGKYKRAGMAASEPKVSKLSAFNGNEVKSKEQWLAEMKAVFSQAYNKLKPKGYLAVFIGEMYRNGRYHFLPYDLSQVLVEIGYIPKANLIWYDVSNSLHVYGYLYDFIPSLIHQNLLIFRKDSK